MKSLHEIETPALIVDERKMMQNIQRLRMRLAGHDGLVHRPHLKTVKCVEIARRLFPDGAGPITVSTLLEAEHFSNAGYKDILYAVGLAPAKLARVTRLREQGVNLTVIIDSVDAVNAMTADEPEGLRETPFLIEIDCDGHRAGVRHDDHETLISIAGALSKAGALVRGVMTHAGGSYDAQNSAEIDLAARNERTRAVACAEALRQAGFHAPVVSIGSTPTALAPGPLDGVTEIRAGVYVFFDLVMAGLGVCATDDIALSVLTTVIGHQAEKGLVITDAGWMALSRDRGAASQTIDQGYGLVCDESGAPFGDLIVSGANQEHGIISMRNGVGKPTPYLPVGTRLRVLPNHACATAAQHDAYHVLDCQSGAVIHRWPRFGGW